MVRAGFDSYGRGKTYTFPEPKLLYQSIPNFEQMIKSVRWRELPNFVVIDYMGAAPHVGEIYSSQFSVFFNTFFPLLLILLLVSSTRLQITIRNGF